MAVDALMGQVGTSRGLRGLRADQAGYVTPPITIGKRNEPGGFPGTLMISKETLREIARSSA